MNNGAPDGNVQASFHLSRTLDAPFEEIVDRVTAALKSEGFGVLTDIDVQATLKKKLGVDFRKYRILGACNPALAHQALQIEGKIGTMLPCNVVVQELDSGGTEVSAVDPVTSMQAVGSAELGEVAGLVRAKLEAVVSSL